MPFGLTIGTERAMALQNAIQDELMAKGYSPDADPVMAEYITIMVINNKTKANITSELEELIGSDFDAAFTDWLFEQAAKGASESESQAPSSSVTSQTITEPASSQTAPIQTPAEPSRRQPTGHPRSGVYQQALSQAIPTGSKRTASARSPSPTGHPSKSRRMDVPTGPRAMQREGPSNANSGNTRSLLDRMGGPPPRRNENAHSHNQHDEIQSRIDNITQNSPEAAAAMMNGGFPGMDMNAMAGMNNPLMLQEMMMSQMALMAQMATSMGMLNNGAFAGPGFSQPGMGGEMGMYPNGQGGQGGPNASRGRGGRGGRGNLRGGGDSHAASRTQSQEQAVETPVIAAPVPITSAAAQTPAPSIPYALPERPQSPTLCKFGMKCTNVQCRYAHPSPVATAESGIVLSNEPCEKGKDCKDKDCVKGHVSPAVLKPQASSAQPTPQPALSSQAAIPCRFGNACTRPNCPFAHPNRPAPGQHYTQPCRFGASCTKATCPFQHPEGRVLPGTFHRGLATTGPIVNIPTPETGSMGATASPHRSMKFVNNNKPPGSSSGLSVKEQMQQQLAAMEARKKEAEQALKDAEAAAANKKEESAAPIPA